MHAKLTESDIRGILFSHNEETRQHFVRHYESEIERFVSNLARAYNRLQDMEPRVLYEQRSAWVDQFLYVALNSLLTSFHLLISGFSIPAGNLMRHYGEAVAMALLLSHRAINTFDELRRDLRFSVQKSLDMIKRRRNARLLGIDSQGWEQFSQITSFYDQYSHASVFVAATTQMLLSEDARQLGGEFDPGKLDGYRREMHLSVSASERLYEAIIAAEFHLRNSRSDGPSQGAAK